MLAKFEWINSSESRSVLPFPVVRMYYQGKESSTPIIISVSVLESIYHSDYPFHYPNIFSQPTDVYDLKTKFAIVSAVSSRIDIRKEIVIEDLLKGANDGNRKKLQKNFIKLFNSLVKENILQNKFHFVQKNDDIRQMKSDQITQELLARARLVYLYEKL